MDLPHKPITFLLTDIEASTEHWESAPHAMPEALERHDAVAAALVSRHGGTVVKSRGEGDSLFAVFHDAYQALHAAHALQRALDSEPWPTPRAVRVRMALHTGGAATRDGDYYGPDVIRCARIRALARGGDILLSGRTREAAGDTPPEGARFRDRGVHHLKGLQAPEHIWELLYRTEDGRRSGWQPHVTNLPRELNSFIGREKEIGAVCELLERSCLVTLAGAGGLGKSRLARQVGIALAPHYPDGVWLVDLSSQQDPSRVAHTVAAELKVVERAGAGLDETLVDHLQPCAQLLILDNCEHLHDSCAALAERLLKFCPDLVLLATSRVPLGIAGEMVHRVPPLATPGARSEDAELLASEAVRLFVDRARAARPDFDPLGHQLASLAAICRQLEGIPLAIELAAARIRSLSVEDMSDLLRDRFRLLSATQRSGHSRHSTLRSAIDWSYDLLSPPEQELFRRLAVFAGSFTMEAVEHICSDTAEQLATADVPGAGIARRKILDLLDLLVNKSLVLAGERAGHTRYRLLETLRQYAAEKLEEVEALHALKQRHVRFYLNLALDAERRLRGRDQARWLARLDEEHENLRAALTTSLANDRDLALSLAAALWTFWHVRGYISEGREWLALALEGAAGAAAERGKALNGAAVLARAQGDLATARDLSLQSLEVKRAVGDRQGIAAALSSLGTVALAEGDFAHARPYYEESLEIERRLGNRQGITACLIGIANVELEEGRYGEAEQLYAESRRIKEELGDPRGVATSITGLGNVALYRGELTRARELHAEALRIRRELGDRRGIATSLQQIARVAMAQQDGAGAAILLEESLSLRVELGDKPGIAQCQLIHALLSQQRGDPEEARAYIEGALQAFQQTGHRRGTASALQAAGLLEMKAGKPGVAQELLRRAEAIREEIGAPLHPVERAELAGLAL